MHIRRARSFDIVRMHAVRTAVHENRLSDPNRITAEDYRALLYERGCGWVCEEGGEIVAFGVADAVRRNVWALFVSPGFERRGMGRALLAEMTRWLFARGTEPIWLTTAPGTRAEGFYRTAGWRQRGDAVDGELHFELTGLP